MRNEERIRTPDVPVVHQCAGTLNGMSATAQRVSMRIEHQKYTPTEISGTLLLLDAEDAKHLFGTFLPEFTVDAQTPYADIVRVWGVRQMSFSGPELSFIASGYDLGCDRAILPEGEDIMVTVELTGGTVLRRWQTRQFSYDGTISHHAGDQENVVWQDQGKLVTALVRTVYEKASTGGNSVTLQIDRPTLWYKFKSDGQTSIRDFVNQTCADLNDVLLLLTLCSRERIQWFEISVDVSRPSSRRVPYPSRRRRFAREVRPQASTDLLVAQRELARNDGFKQLLHGFRSSPHRDILRRAIELEVTSYDGQALETNFILCHAALEALIAQVSRADPSLPKYSRNQREAMSTQVRQAIRAFGADRCVAPDLIEYSLKKVPELHRPPLAETVIRQTQRLLDRDVWFWFWPQSLGFEQGVRLAIRLRNELLHNAASSDLQRLYDNLAPLQILVERLILKLLGWRDDKIFNFYDQHLRGVNRNVEARANREQLETLSNAPRNT